MTNAEDLDNRIKAAIETFMPGATYMAYRFGSPLCLMIHVGKGKDFNISVPVEYGGKRWSFLLYNGATNSPVKVLEDLPKSLSLHLEIEVPDGST